LLAHRVELLRCEGSDAIGAKRTCRERRERLDLTKTPSATLAVHCGNGFGAGFKPLSKYSFEAIQCWPLSLGADMRRREFISLLGGAAAWPLVAGAQQPALPVVGFLNSASPEGYAPMVTAFSQGLKQTGYVEGQNVAMEFRWAEGHYDLLPELAAELVRRQVAVIAAGGPPAALAAKAATSTIPIVFTSGTDPVKLGLVSSFNRPGGNITGVHLFLSELNTKKLALLRDLLPQAKVIGLLLNPTAENAEPQSRDLRAAGQALGFQIQRVNASSDREFESAFATLVEQRVDALVVGSDPFLNSRRDQLVALAARHAIPAVYEVREFADAGGLMTYGTSIKDAYRQAGAYVGQILKGAKAADLPVMQSTKFEFVINIKTAKTLGIKVPDNVLSLADEVIE
jgi:putative tryptophan/tyrosine transport system substrate-binding protein